MSHPLAPAELLRAGYAVTFRSVYTGFRCYQSITGARDGLLRSTVNPVEIAFWPTREDLFAWLQDLGYRLDDPVPIGIGYMRVGIITTSHDLVDPEIDRGTLFEVPAGMKPRPAAHVIPVAPPAVPEPPPAPKHRPYRPSNGSEGDSFISLYCIRCTGYIGGHCSILMRASAHDVGDPEYPPQWVRTDEGPKCTSFVDRSERPAKPRNRIRPAREQTSLF